MEEQRERARADAAAKRAVVTLAELPAIKTEFTGYEGLESEGDVVAILRDDKPVQSLAAGERGIVVARSHVVLRRAWRTDRRSRDDRRADGGLFEVDDTQYIGEAIAHHGYASRRRAFDRRTRRPRPSSTGGGAKFGATTPRRICCSARSRTCSATT